MCDLEDQKEEKAVYSVPKPDKLLGFRHVQYFLMFMCALLGYGMRTNLSEAIVAMIPETNATNEHPDIPTYPEWKEYKNTMLSSFFWGYICLQIGVGEIAKRYGAKNFLGGAMIINSIFSILIPVMGAAMGYQGVIVCRVVQGLSQGFLFPSFHTLLSVWTPKDDRSKVISFVYTGGPLGNVISLIVTGQISDSSWGWPVAFYLYGALGLLWCVVWFILGANSPAECKFIGLQESKYVQSEVNTETKQIRTPWKAIFTSMPLIAIIVSHAGQCWGFWTLLTEIPSYLRDILGRDLHSNSLLSALPYFTLWVLNFFMSYAADSLIKKQIWSIGKTRKVFNSIGLIIPAVALILLSFFGDSSLYLAVVLLVVAVGVNSATYVGFNINHIDISPNHAGILMGITNSLSNICSIVAPLAVDVIKSAGGYEETDKELWTVVFCLAAGIYVFVCIFFNVYGSGEIQEWNDEHYLTNKRKERKENELAVKTP